MKLKETEEITNAFDEVEEKRIMKRDQSIVRRVRMIECEEVELYSRRPNPSRFIKCRENLDISKLFRCE